MVSTVKIIIAITTTKKVPTTPKYSARNLTIPPPKKPPPHLWLLEYSKAAFADSGSILTNIWKNALTNMDSKKV